VASAQVLVLGSPLDGVREQNTRWRGAFAAGGSGAYLAWSQREQLFGVTISAAGVDLLRAVELDDRRWLAGNAKWWLLKRVEGRGTGKEGDNEARSLCPMASTAQTEFPVP
jgi:hypothetical protein